MTGASRATHFQASWAVSKRQREKLTAIERVVFDHLVETAKQGNQARQQDILAAIGSSAVATAPGVVKRLEAKGYITREKYQRGMRVCIPQLGICTAPPANLSPHWRDLPRPPAITIQTLRQSRPQVAMTAEQIARADNRPLPELLSELVQRGLADLLAEWNEL